MKIKVCGLKDPNNIKAVDQLEPDYVGFIFYKPSPRNMDKNFGAVPETNAVRVGVFVNECIETIIKRARNFRLSTIQLHGNEEPDICMELKELGYKVAKAISIDDNTNPDEVEAYADYVDFFVFDTKTELAGGSGKKFNWDKLNEIAEYGPFLLSGGIGPEDAEEIKKLEYDNFMGIDLNSKFEDEPGVKNIDKLRDFFDEFKMIPA